MLKLNPKIFRTGIPILLLFFISDIKAQSDVSAAGGTAVGPDGTMTFSIGVVCFANQKSAGGAYSQGVQQPKEFYSTDIRQILTDIGLSVFPNPSEKLLTIDFHDLIPQNASYSIHDVYGRLIMEGSINTSLETLDLTMMSKSIYFLSVYNDHQIIRVFKINKI